MRVFGVTGFSGSGKTELILKLIQHFCGLGLRVSAVKHAHHGFDVDREGKDSHRYRSEGACEVMVSSRRRWALVHENRGEEEEASLPFLLGHLQEVDLVLVEGYKRIALPKLEVWRQACGVPCLGLPCLGLPCLGLPLGEGGESDVPYPNIIAIAAPAEEHALLLEASCRHEITLLSLDAIAVIADYALSQAVSHKNIAV